MSTPLNEDDGDIDCTYDTSDFNEVPLNGDTPEEVATKYGVEVRVQSERHPIWGYQIWMKGRHADVMRYRDHLKKSWPKDLR